MIVGGGPGCVSDADNEKSETEARIEAAVMSLMPEITERDYPLHGCCYGLGVLAHHLGARVGKERYSEPVSPVPCRLTDEGRMDPLLAELPEDFMALVGHKEAVQEMPPGCAHLVESPACPIQMIRFKSNVYATQFHPEADEDVFELRINIYKNKGYFPPEDAEKLIAACRAAHVYAPERVLRAFVQRYS